MQQPSRASIWTALGAVYIIWGSTYLAIRFVVETMPPFVSAGIRFVIAGGVLFAFRRLRGDPPPARFEWGAAAIVGLLLLTGGNGAVVWAEQTRALGAGRAHDRHHALVDRAHRLPATVAPVGRRVALCASAAPALLGVVIGFVGVVFLVAGGGTDHRAAIDPLGAAVVIFGTFSWACGSLYGRGAKLPRSPLLGTGMEMLIGGIGLLVVGTLTGDWARLDPSAITHEVCRRAALPDRGRFLGRLQCLRLAAAQRAHAAGLHVCLRQSCCRLFLGALLAGEPLTPRVLVAAAIIVGAVVLTTSSRTPRAQA